MLDFITIKVKTGKNGTTIIPSFNATIESNDILVKGKTLYGFWDFVNNKWITKWEKAATLIDKEIMEFTKNYKDAHPEESVTVELLRDDTTGAADRLLNCIKKMTDTPVSFNSKMIFSNQETKKEDYCTIKTKYRLENGTRDNYDKLISTLYDPEERHKIEWLIGAVIAGENLNVQKFGVMYGPPGSGKSTVLEIIYKLFDGYYATFNSKELGNGDSFALSAFKKNPLVAVDAEGDLSKIESNTALNTLTAHDIIKINEKYQAKFDLRPLAIIFICTNSPVKITDSKSGLLRRLIDINPSGRKLPTAEYKRIMKAIPFELGAIAYHCKEVYLEDPEYYENYRPTEMFEETNDFYDFMLTYYKAFTEDNPTVLKVAWTRYKEYIEECGYSYKMNMRVFKHELKNYFKEFELQGRVTDANGNENHASNIYIGFRTELFKKSKDTINDKKAQSTNSSSSSAKDEDNLDIYDGIPKWLCLDSVNNQSEGMPITNPFQSIFSSAHAQYATKTENEAPKRAWKDKNGDWNVATRLADILPNQVHYVLTQDVEPALIVIDFDKKGEDGKKSLRENLLAAKDFPRTYAEVSKGGQGLHLHYIYDGDPDELSRVYDDNIEIKVFKGLSALRRRLSLCNNEPIAHLNSGLPLRGDKGRKDAMIDWSTVKDEKALRTLIRRNLAKEYHADTTSSIHFIKKILDDAYASGATYDVRDLRGAVMNFAQNASNQSQHCMECVMEMEFKSKDIYDKVSPDEEYVEQSHRESDSDAEKSGKPIVFYDIEIMPNLFIVCYKKQGDGGKESCVKLINPTANDVTRLIESSRLIGFNNRKYDNHMLYGRILGYSNQQLFELSGKLIGHSNEDEDSPVFHGFKEAYNLSYTDVYDFAFEKQSLKKWEIDLGIHHQELGLPWDKPVPEELWDTVADYCCNDVVATEAVFNHLKADWDARRILADIAGGSVNDTTNQLSMKIVFGNVKKPKLIYTDLATGKQYESIGGCYVKR